MKIYMRMLRRRVWESISRGDLETKGKMGVGQ